MFKLAKAAAVRVSDMVDHIPADTTSLPIAEIVNGRAVSIHTDGELIKGATSLAIAGILVNEAGAMRYKAPTGETYTSTFINTDKVTFIPVTGSLLFEADFTGTPTAAMIGSSYDLDDADTVDVGAQLTGDFRIVNFKYDTAGAITKLLGFFTNPGYFTS